jgi:hypothetical protein
MTHTHLIYAFHSGDVLRNIVCFERPCHQSGNLPSKLLCGRYYAQCLWRDVPTRPLNDY